MKKEFNNQFATQKLRQETRESWPKEIKSRHGEYIFKLVKVYDGGAKYDIIDAETGEKEIGGRAYHSVEALKYAAEQLIKPQGGRQSSRFEETSMTNVGGATFTPGPGEQPGPVATKKAFKKKAKKEVKDVEPKYAAGKAKIYMKDKWGWKDAPSIPNRPSKGGFIYKQLFEELSQFVKENQPVEEVLSPEDYKKATQLLDKIKDQSSSLYKALLSIIIDIYPHDLEKELGPAIQSAGLNESYSRFKTETKTRNKPDQFHQAVRAVKKKVQEINRLFEYVSRLKEELSEGKDGLKYKIHTEKALAKIKEMVNELNKNIKKFK